MQKKNYPFQQACKCHLWYVNVSLTDHNIMQRGYSLQLNIEGNKTLTDRAQRVNEKNGVILLPKFGH